MQAVWEILFNGQLPLSNSDTVKWNYSNGKYYATAAQQSGGGTGDGDDWAKPIVWSPTKSYKRGEVVVILPTNLVVTTGYVDSVSFVVTKSIAGTWKCTQDSTPATSPVTTNVPQWPLPSQFGNSSPDGPINYWFPVAFYPVQTVDCNGNQTYVANAQPHS